MTPSKGSRTLLLGGSSSDVGVWPGTMFESAASPTVAIDKAMRKILICGPRGWKGPQPYQSKINAQSHQVHAETRLVRFLNYL